MRKAAHCTNRVDDRLCGHCAVASPAGAVGKRHDKSRRVVEHACPILAAPTDSRDLDRVREATCSHLDLLSVNSPSRSRETLLSDWP